jgi:23S rRNA pseudouridine1911/1915/1917 synthase
MSESDDENGEVITLAIGPDEAGQRADKGITALCPDLSRARIQALIESGDVLLNGAMIESLSKKLKEGDVVEVFVPPLESATPEPENIPLDIVYEDEDLLVINKQVGLVVHPGAGNYSGTLVNALLYHCAEDLSGIGGVMRPGIVHRLDKDTSGLMVVAKNDFAHQGLSAQLEDRSLSRIYQALVLKVPVPQKGSVDMPIGRDPRNRLKMSVKGQSARTARTHYRVLHTYGAALSLVECKLDSGRTHQIRVHMAAIKHPLIGDNLYGPQPTAVRSVLNIARFEDEDAAAVMGFERQALHACGLSFIHPATEEVMSFECPPPPDIVKLLKNIEKYKTS